MSKRMDAQQNNLAFSNPSFNNNTIGNMNNSSHNSMQNTNHNNNNSHHVPYAHNSLLTSTYPSSAFPPSLANSSFPTSSDGHSFKPNMNSNSFTNSDSNTNSHSMKIGGLATHVHSPNTMLDASSGAHLHGNMTGNVSQRRKSTYEDIRHTDLQSQQQQHQQQQSHQHQQYQQYQNQRSNHQRHENHYQTSSQNLSNQKHVQSDSQLMNQFPHQHTHHTHHASNNHYSHNSIQKYHQKLQQHTQSPHMDSSAYPPPPSLTPMHNNSMDYPKHQQQIHHQSLYHYNQSHGQNNTQYQSPVLQYHHIRGISPRHSDSTATSLAPPPTSSSHNYSETSSTEINQQSQISLPSSFVIDSSKNSSEVMLPSSPQLSNSTASIHERDRLEDDFNDDDEAAEYEEQEDDDEEEDHQGPESAKSNQKSKPSTSPKNASKSQKTILKRKMPCSGFKKLFDILDKKIYPDVTAWNEDGTSFILKNSHRFATEILPQLFKHRNIHSFIRQLNKYDFHKVKDQETIRIFGDQVCCVDFMFDL